uniref:Uncharacterized protein n=1 Tax=Phaeomonas parva TaxID=124430 RepID=A0A7S1U6T1_9STRA|mmetsp:Transcript_31148/g.98874  ORF Transcript_31148/g.98874 Transcript_31148/m.98874 type:complete len:284 (+) Transcript_31148:169-1020(+)
MHQGAGLLRRAAVAARVGGRCLRLGGKSQRRWLASPADYVAKQVAKSSLDKAIDALQRESDAFEDVLGVDKPTVEGTDGGIELKSSLRREPNGLLTATAAATRDADPFALVSGHITSLGDGIKHLLGSDHPVLQACAQYFFELDGGKKIRPTMVLLVAAACGGIDDRQRRLAEITEMIHTASLFHDDVIDKADTRRGEPSVNRVFGNKMAILAGDFLLARASISLARLRNLEAVELLSTVIEHLVKVTHTLKNPNPNPDPTLAPKPNLNPNGKPEPEPEPRLG